MSVLCYSSRHTCLCHTLRVSQWLKISSGNFMSHLLLYHLAQCSISLSRSYISHLVFSLPYDILIHGPSQPSHGAWVGAFHEHSHYELRVSSTPIFLRTFSTHQIPPQHCLSSTFYLSNIVLSDDDNRWSTFWLRPLQRQVHISRQT